MSEVVSRPVNMRPLGASGNGKPRKRDLRSSANNSEARSQMLLAAMLAFRDGDFSWRLPSDWADAEGRIAEAFNQTIAQEDRISREVERLSMTVGKEGRLKQRMSLPGAIGGWATKVELHQHAHRRSRAADRRSRAHDRRGGQGRPRAVHGTGGRTGAPSRANFFARRSSSTR